MNINDLLHSQAATVLILGIAGAIGYSIKEVPTKAFKLVKKWAISRFIFTVKIHDYDDLFPIMEKWLYKNHNSIYRDVYASISNISWDNNNNGKKLPDITFRTAPTIFTIRYMGKRIVISKERKDISHAQDFRSLFAHTYVVWGYSAKDEIMELLKEARNFYYSDMPKNSVAIRCADSYGNYNDVNHITVKPIDRIILNAELKAMLMADINAFLNGKNWYNENMLHYKRGYGFYGPPGTGKTSLCLAIASYAEQDVYVININGLQGDSALQMAFSNIRPGSMLIIEDIDALFGNNERHTLGKVSFSGLLNCLDGAFHKEGVIICITTNHIDRLDPALIRTGRCDLKVEIPYAGAQEISAFMTQFYGINITIDHDVHMPMAEVQEICISNKKDYNRALFRIESAAQDRIL